MSSRHRGGDPEENRDTISRLLRILKHLLDLDSKFRQERFGADPGPQQARRQNSECRALHRVTTETYPDNDEGLVSSAARIRTASVKLPKQAFPPDSFSVTVTRPSNMHRTSSKQIGRHTQESNRGTAEWSPPRTLKKHSPLALPAVASHCRDVRRRDIE